MTNDYYENPNPEPQHIEFNKTQHCCPLCDQSYRLVFDFLNGEITETAYCDNCEVRARAKVFIIQ